MNKIEFCPIGRVIQGREEVKDDDWDSVSSTIALDAEGFTADALAGLDAFSHVEIIFYMPRHKWECAHRRKLLPSRLPRSSGHPKC